MGLNIPVAYCGAYHCSDNRKFLNSSALYVVLIFISIFMGLSITTYAIPKETLDSLVNENRVISTPLELHLRSVDSPIVNSTVSLNQEDAWLFFDNIKPSVVIANYASNVLINGNPLSVGGNGRVAIYGHGTVVMPFGSTFKPLTVYTEENFDGASEQLSVAYHKDLGDFDNAIKSFKLKRGYMATFANNADGSGYSRVFIADNQDLEFAIMPDELYHSVSFIRVFKYQWVTKKGKAGWNPNDINATCYYDWNIGGSSSSDVEYVTIRQNGGWPSWTDINNKPNVNTVLGFNEPDHTDQANMNFQQMIDQWPDFMKSGLRIGSPAWANPWSGDGGNLFDFIDKCDELNYRVDFVALHCYWGGKSPQNWYNDLKYIHDRTGRPLWITEWNNGANWTTEWWPDGDHSYTDANAQKQLDDIKGILQVLDTTSFIERYFIYDWVQDCRAMVLNGKLTKAGEYYAADTSEIAFSHKNEVIPHWNYLKPELSYRYVSLYNSIRLNWTDQNGELSKSYKIEKKANNGAYQTIYETDDVSTQAYLDSLDPNIGGTITYRLSLRTPKGDSLQSNEVSYYQTQGADTIQVGNFSVANDDWNTALFSKKYSASPLVILGIPTFNNVAPMTQAVNNVTSTLFKFHFYTWLYLNNPPVTKSDMLSAITLPSGDYDFGGLKVETKEVSGVTRDWATVNFDEAFAKKPVVFCTIGSIKNAYYPLTVAVKNVTTTGFELSLKSEEQVTGALSPENISYFAIEPGHGSIDGKRITVGQTAEGSGVSSTPLELAYDTSYTEPAIFAGLLSDEDNFASTLRYYFSGDHKFKIFKQRELSGGVSSVHKDQLGWMVIDLAADQPDVQTSVPDSPVNNQNLFYPNPAESTLHFNLKKMTRVEIFDLAGHKLLQSNVVKSMDISSLDAGMYLVKIKGSPPTKFIKK